MEGGQKERKNEIFFRGRDKFECTLTPVPRTTSNEKINPDGAGN